MAIRKPSEYDLNILSTDLEGEFRGTMDCEDGFYFKIQI